MRYRIEYADKKCCDFAEGRSELLKCLNQLKRETVADIRKVYKNGVSDSVMDIYAGYIGKGGRCYG